jgi:hypothetical protein
MSNTNKLTQWAIDVLSADGSQVWRNNNLAVKGRKFIGRKGVPDIVGYDKTGIAIYCEVKSGNDKLSEEQITFMTHATSMGCQAWIATDIDGGYKIVSFNEYYTARM